MKSQRVVLTGASGFLGRYFSAQLVSEQLTTVGRGRACAVRCDLANSEPELPVADLVIHAAGHAHAWPHTDEERAKFFRVNEGGTTNLLRALDRRQNPSAFVYISSVAVYGLAHGHRITEAQSTNAREPYGASKAAAEALVTEWCASRGVRCAILRLPLLVGFSPPGNLGAMLQAIRRGVYVNIDSGHVSKSMVLARDVAAIALRAAQVGGTFNLTDGVHPTISALSRVIAIRSGCRIPRSIPNRLATLLAVLGDATGGRFPLSSARLANLRSELTFDDSLARSRLGWSPQTVLDGDWVTSSDVRSVEPLPR